MIASPAERGFTLIELLMVIAIIGILSAIVLSSLNLARSRGNDAGIQRALNEARTQADLFLDANNGKYVVTRNSATDVCNVNGLVGSTKGAYEQISRAASISGVTLNTTYTTLGAWNLAVCHTCTSPAVGCTGAYANSWAASVPLKSSTQASPMYYCVDSHGFSGVSPNFLASGDTWCAQ